MIRQEDIGYKEIIMNLDNGIVIRLTIASLKKIIKQEIQNAKTQ